MREREQEEKIRGERKTNEERTENRVRIMEREIVRKVNSDQSLKNVLSRITLATQLLLYSRVHTIYISC